jgi:hypothetical protein
MPARRYSRKAATFTMRPYALNISHGARSRYLPGCYEVSFKTRISAARVEGNMTLHEPSQAIFIVSLVLFVIAWIGYFAGIPFIGNHPSLLTAAAYLVLALGCLL